MYYSLYMIMYVLPFGIIKNNNKLIIKSPGISWRHSRAHRRIWLPIPDDSSCSILNSLSVRHSARHQPTNNSHNAHWNCAGMTLGAPIPFPPTPVLHSRPHSRSLGYPKLSYSIPIYSGKIIPHSSHSDFRFNSEELQCLKRLKPHIFEKRILTWQYSKV